MVWFLSLQRFKEVKLRFLSESFLQGTDIEVHGVEKRVLGFHIATLRENI